MGKRTKLADRVLPAYTTGEEIFNMVTHIVGGAWSLLCHKRWKPLRPGEWFCS